MEAHARVDIGDALDVAQTAPYDVVALVASAGGRAALECVLHALPSGFPIPIVVMQHLAHDVCEPLRPFAASLPFSVEWATTGAALAPQAVLVAPPRSFLEILPDATCVVSPCELGARAKPMDRLLQSVARSFAHRAVGVVLSGMMDDGADGARALHAEGGYVIVQSDAEYAEMPHAAIRSGGVDVKLPAEEIATLLIELAAGAAIPRPLSELQAVEALFTGEGRVRAAMRDVHWATTPLGSVLEWPPALSIAVRNVMSSTFPTCIYWGPELVQIYNEAFLPILGAKPSPAGKPARLTWPEVWSALGLQLQSVLQTGRALCAENRLIQSERHGYPEEAYVTYSYSPLHDDEGRVCGVLNTSTETTERVRASRRLELLRELAAVKGGESALAVAEKAAKALADAPLDVPFAVIYLFDRARTRANLAATVGVNAGTLAAPHALLLGDPTAIWPLAEVSRSEVSYTVDDLASRLPRVHAGPWPEAPSSATLLPLCSGADGAIAGVIVLGASPRLRFDASYDDFLRLIARHVSAAIGEAEARRRDRERSERLAELDRAKVEFFSNVSHEFRTPLTLLLSPLEEMLGRRASLPADLACTVEAAARNGRRLFTLVNTLLDFSQAESHRQQAQLEPTDLAALTRDIASAFRSAIEAAGLRFDVQCDSPVPLVPVDREMWEKIVSNLLSNALKFTFEGTISVRLEALKLHAQLMVTDTGIGVAEAEIPNLFKRFHRVRGARARTAEGSGIGLWTVDDLVKRIGAQMIVRSKENTGTTFRIWLPYTSTRSRLEQAEARPTLRATAFANQAAFEASRWGIDALVTSGARGDVLDDVFGPPREMTAPTKGKPLQGRVLVVDDNADMRDYLERLLGPRWEVESAADGMRALEVAARFHPDVVLADVMMPGVDGFELLKRIRGHADLRHTPVVLLTARTGEGAAIDGLLAGADDYVAKPFSPRELVARIAAAVERARADAALRKSEEKYRKLFHSIDEGFCIMEVLFDGQGKAVDYRFLEMNPVFVAQTGFGDVTGKTMRELAPRHEEFWFETYGDVARTGQARRFEHRSAASGRWYDVYAFRIGSPEERKIAVLFNDITDRKHADETLRVSETRKAFQLELADAVRPLADPAEIQRSAMRVLGKHLEVDRVSYVDVAEEGETAVAHDTYTGPGVRPWTGGFSLADLGEPAERIRRGETVVVRDARALTRSSDADGDGTDGARASISVPLVKGGRLAAVLLIQQDTPRWWTDAEITLAQEAAERTWVALARGRAETELLARNDELERFNSVTVGRELRMIELEKQIDALQIQIGDPSPDPLLDVRAASEPEARLAGRSTADDAHDDVPGSRRATLNVLEGVARARDLAEQRYRELCEREAWLRGQREALELAVNDASLDSALGVLVRTATEALGEGTRAAVYLANEDGATLCHVVGMPDEYAAAVDGIRIGPESLAWGLAAHTGEFVLTADVLTDPRWEPWRWLAERFDYRGCWSLPIRTHAGKIVGVLAIYSREPRGATERDLELGSLLTNTASIIICRHTRSEVRKRAGDERKTAEQALRDSETRFRALVMASCDAIYRMSPDWSEMRALEGQGFTADTPEPTNAWMNRYIHPDDQASVKSAVARAIDARGVFELKHRLRRADGSFAWVFSRAIPIVGDDGQIIEWLGSATQVTRRKQTREASAKTAE